MTLSVQFTTMFAMVLSGLYLGMIRDTYLYFTKYWKENTIFAYVMEISFWLSQTFILYSVLFFVNFGELRLYIFLACLLGFATYQALIANVYQKILQYVIHGFTALCRLVKNIINRLIVKPVQLILQLCVALIMLILKTTIFLLEIMIKLVFTPIKWFIILIYSLLPQKIKKNLHKLAGFYSRIENIYTNVKDFFASKRRK